MQFPQCIIFKYILEDEILPSLLLLSWFAKFQHHPNNNSFILPLAFDTVNLWSCQIIHVNLLRLYKM